MFKQYDEKELMNHVKGLYFRNREISAGLILAEYQYKKDKVLIDRQAMEIEVLKDQIRAAGIAEREAKAELEALKQKKSKPRKNYFSNNNKNTYRPPESLTEFMSEDFRYR